MEINFNQWLTFSLHCLWNFKYFLNDNNSISELLIVIINVSQLSIDSHKTRIWKMYEQNTWWREIYRRSRVSSSFLVASALLFTISTCRLYTVLSLPLYIFFYSLVALPFVQLKANTHQRNFTWHRTQTLSFILQTY